MIMFIWAVYLFVLFLFVVNSLFPRKTAALLITEDIPFLPWHLVLCSVY